MHRKQPFALLLAALSLLVWCLHIKAHMANWALLEGDLRYVDDTALEENDDTLVRRNDGSPFLVDEDVQADLLFPLYQELLNVMRDDLDWVQTETQEWPRQEWRQYGNNPIRVQFRAGDNRLMYYHGESNFGVSK